MKSTIALTILALNANAVLAVDYSAAVCKNPSDYLPDHFEDDGDTCNELALQFQMTSTANCSTAVLDSYGNSMKSKTDMLGLPARARGSRYKCCGTGQGACQPDPIDYSAAVCKNPSDYLPEHAQEDDGMTCNELALQFQMTSTANCSTAALDSHGNSEKSKTDMLGLPSLARGSRYKCCGTGQGACQPDPIDYSAVVCKNPSDYLPEHKEEDDGMTCDARALQFQMPSKADCSTEALDSHGTSKKSMTDMLQSRFKCCGTGQSACGAEGAAAAERFTQASLLATILLAVTSMMMC